MNKKMNMLNILAPTALLMAVVLFGSTVANAGVIDSLSNIFYSFMQEPNTKPQEPGTKPQEPGTKPQEPGTKPQEPGT